MAKRGDDEEPTGRVTKSVHFPFKDWPEVDRAVRRYKKQTGSKASESGYFSAAVIRQAREENAAEDAAKAARIAERGNGDKP